jgi:hypothetical protein
MQTIMTTSIPGTLNRLATSRFRAGFHLGPRESAIIQAKGIPTISQHANELIAARLAPAQPHNDGKQTPMRGHPVFIAQHATATCCRTCLAKWHAIPSGRALTPAEQSYIVGLIMAWISRH